MSGDSLSSFFQAEDGIRDGYVTGVQTCALPIVSTPYSAHGISGGDPVGGVRRRHRDRGDGTVQDRSEERRVGNEGGSQRPAEHENDSKTARGALREDTRDETDEAARDAGHEQAS